MSNDSNVTDNNTNTLSIDKLQIANNNEDEEPSALTSLGKIIKTKVCGIMFGGGQDEEVVNKDEPSPLQPSKDDDASSPTDTSTTSSVTLDKDATVDEKKTDIPQDAGNDNNNSQFVQTLPFFMQSSSTTALIKQQSSPATTPKSIIVLRGRQLVTNTAYPDKGKNVEEQLSTSTNQLSLSNDTGLSLELGDVNNNSLSRDRGGSLFSELRDSNPKESPPQNKQLTPNRVSKSSELGGGNNDGTLVLYSGNNNNNNDSTASSLGDDESVSWSGSGDTIVNLDTLKAQQEDLVGKYDALLAKRDERLSEEQMKVAILTERNESLHEQVIQALKKGEDTAHLFAEIEKNETSILRLFEMSEQFFKEIDFSQEKIIHSTKRIETAIFQLARQMEKNHDEVMAGQGALMDSQQQKFAEMSEKLDQALREVRDLTAMLLEKKSNSYNLFRKGRR